MFLTSTRVPNGSVPRGRSETFASTRIWPRSMSASRRADRAQQQLQLLGVAAGLLGGPDVRLGDDLHQRRAGPVEVDEADLAAAGVGGVDELGGVLLEVGPGDADGDRPVRRLERSAGRPTRAAGRTG